MTDFLVLSFVFLVAGVVAVPIASKLGLGSVLGYLIAGIAISPLLVALNVDVISIQHFAEFGVVMMLFLVGLELEPKLLWQMRNRLLGLGGLQVCGTALLVMVVAMLLGFVWSVSLAIGLVLALSSTAIVLQTLGEKGLMKSDGGQGSFSVLLFQDIAVIPMLALIPLLALPELVEATHAVAEHGAEGGSHAPAPLWIETLPGWQRGLLTLGAIGAVIGAGSFLTSPIFRFISTAKLRELFVATALTFVIGIALLMTFVGLSPALGTFIAGVVLANSEYRHELESDIDPFKGLLLGLFFMTVGAGINFELLFGSFGTVLALTLGLILLKMAVLYALGVMFKIEGADRWLLALGLAQAGEFGFVLLSFTVANAVIPADVADQLLLVVALSMLLTPALFILYDRVFAPRFSASQEREADEIEEKGTVIIAGHGRFGGIVNRMLRGAGHTTVVLDHSSSQLDMLRAFGLRAFFGDATRPICCTRQALMRRRCWSSRSMTGKRLRNWCITRIKTTRISTSLPAQRTAITSTNYTPLAVVTSSARLLTVPSGPGAPPSKRWVCMLTRPRNPPRTSKFPTATRCGIWHSFTTPTCPSTKTPPMSPKRARLWMNRNKS